MRTGFIVLRAAFIGLAIVFGILWLVWMFDMNAYTKYQILWGSIDMVMLRRILAGLCIISICLAAATLRFQKMKYRIYVMIIILFVYMIGFIISLKTAPDTDYYTFHHGSRELVVMEEKRDNRRLAVFYERKNSWFVEYLGNMDYYGDTSAFESGNFDIFWEDDGQVIVKVKAQFENTTDGSNIAYGETYTETKETKSQVFYVED